jgi:hypothetical protein
MGVLKRVAAVTALVGTALVPTLGTAGAAGYDNSNPSSTKCTAKSQVAVAGSAQTYGAWVVELRRSNGCNTIWARARRTDGKKCATGGVNCVKIQLQRVKSDGTKVVTAWRNEPGGATRVLSFQLDVIAGATYTGRIATFGGTAVGSTVSIKV